MSGLTYAALRDYLLPRRHTRLLIAIVIAFAVRPLIGDVGDAPIVFSIAMLVLMLVALYFPIFIYFSLTTLSTIGFGDITPLTLQARYAAVAEGITGQFYLAILVARLVGMQMVRSGNPDTHTQARALGRSIDS
jgi:ion channel